MLTLSRDTQCEALTTLPNVMRDWKLSHEEPGPYEAQLEVKDTAKRSSRQKMFYVRITH